MRSLCLILALAPVWVLALPTGSGKLQEVAVETEDSNLVNEASSSFPAEKKEDPDLLENGGLGDPQVDKRRGDVLPEETRPTLPENDNEASPELLNDVTDDETVTSEHVTFNQPENTEPSKISGMEPDYGVEDHNPDIFPSDETKPEGIADAYDDVEPEGEPLAESDDVSVDKSDDDDNGGHHPLPAYYTPSPAQGTYNHMDTIVNVYHGPQHPQGNERRGLPSHGKSPAYIPRGRATGEHRATSGEDVLRNSEQHREHKVLDNIRPKFPPGSEESSEEGMQDAYDGVEPEGESLSESDDVSVDKSDDDDKGMQDAYDGVEPEGESLSESDDVSVDKSDDDDKGGHHLLPAYNRPSPAQGTYNRMDTVVNVFHGTQHSQGNERRGLPSHGESPANIPRGRGTGEHRRTFRKDVLKHSGQHRENEGFDNFHPFGMPPFPIFGMNFRSKFQPGSEESNEEGSYASLLPEHAHKSRAKQAQHGASSSSVVDDEEKQSSEHEKSVNPWLSDSDSSLNVGSFENYLENAMNRYSALVQSVTSEPEISADELVTEALDDLEEMIDSQSDSEIRFTKSEARGIITALFSKYFWPAMQRMSDSI